MMRKNKRKHSPSPTEVQTSNKRQKYEITSHHMRLPTPHHIAIATQGFIQYHFDDEENATLFLRKLQSNQKLNTSNIKIMIKRSSLDAKIYSIISLSADQFDLIFGRHAYQSMQAINTIICGNDFGYAELLPQLAKLDSNLLNQAALLRDDNDDGVYTLKLAAMYFETDQFIEIGKRLSLETCNRSALLQDIDGGSVFTSLAYFSSIEAFMFFASRLNANICAQSLLLPTKSKTCALEHLIESNPSETAWLKLMGMLSEHPDAIKAISEKIPHLKKIDICDGGRASDSWSSITKAVIDLAPSAKKRKAEADLSETLHSVKSRRFVRKTNFLNSLSHQGWRFLRLQGRTVLLVDKDNITIYAIKIKKENESQNELKKEYNTTLYLKEHADELNLKSDLPTPIGIGKISNLLAWLKPHLTELDYKTLKVKIGKKKSHSTYLYQVNHAHCDYFTYLHDPDLSDEAYQLGNEKSVHDLFTLLCRGVVFPQLADIFHNTEHVDDRDDKGRYMVLVNLLRNLDLTGSGRLTNWKNAIEYPNVRGSGLADLGDRVSINDYFENGSIAEKYYQETLENYGDKASNYLIANVMAEYQYILFLIAGRRGCHLTEKAQLEATSIEAFDARSKEIWSKLAIQVINNCALALSIVTPQREDEAKRFLGSIVNVERLSRQMQYWMTGDYIADIRQNKIPEDIYGKNVDVEVDIDGFRDNTFNNHIGCSLDGIHPDLGPVNGQEPIKEANKLFYWMVSTVFTAYHQVNLTLKDVHSITSEHDLIKSESLRKQSFSHLPEKSYHAIQFELCNERLKQEAALPRDIRDSVKAEAESHRRSHAALTILNFWRCKKSEKAEKSASQDNRCSSFKLF